MVRILAFVTLLGLAACAGGRPPPPNGLASPAASRVVAAEALLFIDFDANHDRRIDQAELTRGVDAGWTELAGDAATVGPVDLRNWLERALGSDEFDFNPVFFDENLDGRVSRAEFATILTRRFGALDGDKDGVLARAELSRRVQGGLRESSARPGAPDGSAGRGGPPPR